MSGNTFSFPFKIHLIGAPVADVTAGPAELARAERKFGAIGNTIQVNADGSPDIGSMKFEWLCYLAWLAQSRIARMSGGETQEFEDWLDRLEDLEVEADADADPEEATDPTPPVPAAALPG